ncbi:Hypothetical protein FKW44_020122 [Caligus rogercresseyi]|uniref:Uncharacterized protein n=1 Tax=Caligus rogercresseyi TaxID=217165 RepID=A0A7T8GWS8_CALRO|nr:Hypothetical protein FKW44_020122 [Caligus rogercresseyi]
MEGTPLRAGRNPALQDKAELNLHLISPQVKPRPLQERIRETLQLLGTKKTPSTHRSTSTRISTLEPHIKHTPTNQSRRGGVKAHPP